MANLFEKFVLNFYKKECLQYRVGSEQIKWDATGEDITYLPKMKTDITFEGKNDKIIIDTKYYSQTMRNYFEKESIISGHLYQLYAYLSNYEKGNDDKPLTGILLYPRVQKDLNLLFDIKGYKVKICTVDLNKQWQGIHKRLLEVVS